MQEQNEFNAEMETVKAYHTNGNPTSEKHSAWPEEFSESFRTDFSQAEEIIVN